MKMEILTKIVDIVVIGIVIYIASYFASINALNDYAAMLNELGCLNCSD